MTKKSRNRLPVTVQPSVAVFKAEHYSGPLPPPEMLLKYNSIVPGLAERIVSMVEQQQEHRHDLEKKVVYANERRAHIGQSLAFGIAILGIVAGVYLTMNDKSAEGLASIITPLATIAGIFVYGRITQRKELAAKDRVVNR